MAVAIPSAVCTIIVSAGLFASATAVSAQTPAYSTSSNVISAAAPDAPAAFDHLFLPAAAAATAGGAIGYEIGMRWRFLGSTETQAKRREALLLGLVGGTVASGVATLAAADDADNIVARKAFMSALTGVVPATALAAAATMPLPDWLQKPVGVLVYGIVQGGVTAWMAGK